MPVFARLCVLDQIINSYSNEETSRSEEFHWVARTSPGHFHLAFTSSFCITLTWSLPHKKIIFCTLHEYFYLVWVLSPHLDIFTSRGHCHLTCMHLAWAFSPHVGIFTLHLAWTFLIYLDILTSHEDSHLAWVSSPHVHTYMLFAT